MWHVCEGLLLFNKGKVLLVLSGPDVNRSAEAKLVDMYVYIVDHDMGGEDGPGKSDRVVTVEAPKEKRIIP